MASGPLRRPEFGPLPELSSRKRRSEPKFAYSDILDVVREHPGQWAKIAEFTKGGKKKTLTDLRYAHNRIWHHLCRWRKTENWQIKDRTVPETWCDRELWVMYVGPQTEEEFEAKAQARHEVWLERRANGEKRRADKEARARLGILKEQQSGGAGG